MDQIIIRKLKLYPEYNIIQVAQLLSVPTKQVSEAQRAYLRRFVKADSPLWGPEGQSVLITKSYKNN